MMVVVCWMMGVMLWNWWLVVLGFLGLVVLELWLVVYGNVGARHASPLPGWWQYL